jgi:hypothetical protein
VSFITVEATKSPLKPELFGLKGLSLFIEVYYIAFS